ncbi:MAG: hypothetical protein U0166_14480 [Acidobacteriota bacterium]
MAFDVTRGRLIYFAGRNGQSYGETFDYDGARWNDVTPTPSPSPRQALVMAYDSARGVVVVFGGSDAVGYLNDTWEFRSGAWVPGPAAPPGLAPRDWPVLVFDESRAKIVLFGGRGGNGPQPTFFNDSWLYDGLSWVSGPVAPANMTPRYGAAAAYDAGRAVTVMSGGTPDGYAVLSDTWELGAAGWVQGVDAPVGVALQGMAYHRPLAKLLMFGGIDATYTWRNDTWAYDRAAWTVVAPPPAALVPRAMHSMAYDPERRRIVVRGGSDSSGQVLADTWELNPEEQYLVGSGLTSTNPNEVRIFESIGCGTYTVDFFAYSAGRWGVNVAAGDLDTAEDEILTGPGPGPTLGPQVRGFTSAGASMGKVNFYAYGTLRYGTNVSLKNVDVDSYEEVLVGPGPGAVFGPHVRGFNYDASSVTPISKVSFFAYGTLKFGVRVDGGDLEDDGFEEMVTGPGPGVVFGSQIRGWDFDGNRVTTIAKVNFNAGSSPSYGSIVATGDVDADRFREIVTVPSGGCDVAVFNYDGTIVSPLYTLVPFPGRTGCHCAAGAFGGLDSDDVAVGEGSTGGSNVLVFEVLSPLSCSFQAFPSQAGATVYAADL